MASKFKQGDKVVIAANDIQPQYVNKVGIVKKVYRTFSEGNTGEPYWLYRIEVNNETLRGVADEHELMKYGGKA